jgi:AraC-like DNA-binding protein
MVKELYQLVQSRRARESVYRYEWPAGEVVLSLARHYDTLATARRTKGHLWLAFRLFTAVDHAPARVILASNGHFKEAIETLAHEPGEDLVGVIDYTAEFISRSAKVPPNQEAQLVSKPVAISTNIMETQLIRSLAELAVLQDERLCTPLFANHSAGLLLVDTLRRYCDLSNFLSQPKKGGLAPWQLRRIESFIEGNIGEQVSVATLQEIAGLSSSHFIRAFRASTGVTPAAYLRRKRLEAARSLLLSTSEPIEAIAADCGFPSQAHFSTLFKQTFEMSPMAVRRAGNMNVNHNESST